MKENTKELSKKATNIILNILNKELERDANSTSCVFLYQPKEPKELMRFKK